MAKTTTLLDKINNLIYANANFSTNDNTNTNDSYSTNFSPNNLRTVILSPQGAIFVFHTTTGNQSRLVRRVDFPQTQDNYIELTEKKELLSFLVGERIFTSVEEIVIIGAFGTEPTYTMPKRQIDYIKTKILKRLTRLKDVVLVNQMPMSLEEFQQAEEEYLKQGKFIGDDPNVSSAGGTIIPVYPKWYDSINLRPAYYALDDPDKDLSRKLHKIQDHYHELEVNPDATATTDSETPMPDTNLDSKSLQAINDLGILFQIVQNIQITRDKFISSNKLDSQLQTNNQLADKYVDTLHGKVPFMIKPEDEDSHPDLPAINKYLVHLNNDSTKGMRTLPVASIHRLRNFILKHYIDRVKQVYYSNRANNATALDYALHYHFMALTKSGHYNALLGVLKKATQPLTKEFATQLVDILSSPFQVLPGSDISIPVLEDHDWTSLLLNDNVLQSSELKTIKLLAQIEAGYKLTTPTEAQTAIIIHDYMNLVGKLNHGYLLKSLSSKSDKDKAHFDPQTINQTLDDYLDELLVNRPEFGISSTDTNNHTTIPDPDTNSDWESWGTENPDANDAPVPDLDTFKPVDLPPVEVTKEEESDLTVPVDDDTPDLPVEELNQSSEQESLDQDKEYQEQENKLAGKTDYEKCLYWIDKINNLSDNEVRSSARGLLGVLKAELQDTQEILAGSQESGETKLDKDTEETLLNDLMNLLINQNNTDTDLSVYLVLKQDYFNNLKSFRTLNSGNTTLPEGFDAYFNLSGKTATLDKYYQHLYYIMRGRIR